MSEVVANFAEVKRAIAGAATRAGRGEDSVTLVAVSKTHGPDLIRPVLAAGHRVFGENRVQEAKGKWPALKDAFPGIELHLIGPLQTNKVREAVALFDVIETLDRPKLARALADEMARCGRRVPCCIQVNTGRELQKAGVDPDQADQLVRVCREEYGLTIAGAMCIPPADQDPEPHFRLLAEIAERNGLPMVSMGMSGDYEAAVRCGATHVRIGSAIFGHRPYPA